MGCARILKDIDMDKVSRVGGVLADPTVKAVLEQFKKSQVIEEWHEGANFFRKYASGFIEQGGFLSESGQTQITLHTAFQSTDYCVLFGFYQSSWVQGIWTETRYTNRVEIRGGSSASASGATTKPTFWYACGY